MGGRLDAVNVFDTDCAVITSIDVDHVDYLGPDREAIGREKAGVMRAGRPVIVSDPMPPQSVLDEAARIGADLWRFGRDFNYSGDKLQWNWAGRVQRFNALGYPALRGANQLLNASGVLAAFEALRERVPITAQAVRTGFALVELPGRFQIVPGQPTLILDVAHNPHAAATLARNLDQMGFFPRTHAVFGAMRDKDLPAHPRVARAAGRSLALHRPARTARGTRRRHAEMRIAPRCKRPGAGRCFMPCRPGLRRSPQPSSGRPR